MFGFRIQIFIIILLSVSIIAGCRGGNSKKRPSDTVVVAIASEPTRLNPVFLSDLVSYTVSGLIFSGLTKFDKDMNIIGDLAESWEILQGGREVRFHLKKNVLWHDGVEFSADDVVFTYTTMVAPETASHLDSNFGPVGKVKALDRYTVAIFYSEPYGSVLESWTTGIIPKHVFQNKDIHDISFDNVPVGTGPYRLKQWVHGQKLYLESFDGYHAGKPKIRNLIICIIPDVSTQFMVLKTGDIDLMELSPTQYKRGTYTEPLSSEFIHQRSGSFRFGFLGLNLLDKRFQDKRVRQAISHAINKDSIINAFFMGLGNRSTGPYPPEVWYYNHNARYFEYNPVKAEELLKSAGWRKGTDGILQKDGASFKFTLLTNYENKENVKIAQVIQSNLKMIGIEADIQTLEWQTFRHDVISKHQFEAIILSRAYLWDPDIYDLWHSSKTKKDEWNYLSYKNPEVDLLLEKGRRIIDRKKRKKIYWKVHELLAEEQSCIFLYNADLLFITQKRIKGITPSPAGMLYNIADWRIEQ
jgi:peptide/nickel transport system substrate-binding protein